VLQGICATGIGYLPQESRRAQDEPSDAPLG
jgi:hypothetical protein